MLFRGCHKHREWVQREVGREENMKNLHFKLNLNSCPAGSKERSCILPVLTEENWQFLQQREEERADFCNL